MYELRPYQIEAIAEIERAWESGHRSTILVLATGLGKCLARGTPVMMADGTVRAVEQIRPLDRVMGPDGESRIVTSTVAGIDRMYRVTPTKGETYEVNEAHVLSLRISGDRSVTSPIGTHKPGSVVNISVRDYLRSSRTFRHVAKGWRVGVDFRGAEMHAHLPPYILGAWLGDGTTDAPAITVGDEEIANEWQAHAYALGLFVDARPGDGCTTYRMTTRHAGSRGNLMTRALRDVGVMGNKHIPHGYKTASRAARLELLAGIIDTDGSAVEGSGFDYVTKIEHLARDVAFVARSLGLAAYVSRCTKTCGNNGVVGVYWRVGISGDCSIVPCRVPRKRASVRRQKKDPLVTGISVEPIGLGVYHGFTLEGRDRLFLLGDFTVTHNTTVFTEIARRARDAKRGRTLVLAHRIELVEQAAARLETGTLTTEIESGDRRASWMQLPVSDAVIATVQTMRGRRLKRWPRDAFGTIVIDECFVSSTRVDTPIGPRRISDVKAGDLVVSWDEATSSACVERVAQAWSRSAPSTLVRVSTRSGTVVCTSNHPFLTGRGWVPAGALTIGDIVIQSHDATKLQNDVRRLRDGDGQAAASVGAVQVRPVYREGEACQARATDDAVRLVRDHCDAGRSACVGGESARSRVLLDGACVGDALSGCQRHHGGNQQSARVAPNEGQKPNDGPGCQGARGEDTEEDRARPEGQGWERAWPDAGSVGDLTGTWVADGGRGEGWPWSRERVAYALQDRRGERRTEGCDRGGRRVAWSDNCEERGCAEDGVSSGVRVDRVEVLQRGGDGEYERLCPDGLVWNLEVERTHTYSVAGHVVHNCHHATARAYRDVLEHFSSARVLGVTATPDRGDEVALGHVFESTAFTYGIREGIEGGYLAPLRCKTIDLDCVSLDGVRVTRQEHGRDLSAEDVAKAMSGDEALHAIAAPVAKEAGARKTLIFMPSVELTHELARVLSGYVGADRVRSLDGSCDKDDRKEQLRAYTHGDVQFMINCALFTEGFDAPSTSCVVIARPTKSRALYAQMVGRGTRLAEGKADCLVIDLHPSNTRHDLAKVADIFDGLDLPDDGEERDLFDAAIRSGETVLDARKQAKEIHAKREAARRADRERARMQAQVTYRAVERPMWSVDIALGVTASMYGSTVPPAREDQLERLRALKLDVDPRETVQSASAKIKAMIDRRKSGLCTIKQARVLARAGLNPNMTFDQARTAMDMLVANRWRATPDMIARWGAR